MHLAGEFAGFLLVDQLKLPSNSVEQEEILAKENKLTALPESLVELIAIERIDVRRNDLHSIPLRLSRMVR